MSSKRLVRRQSLISKVQSFPFDTYLYLNEIRLSIDWDEYAISLGLPLGIATCSLSILIQSILSYNNSINKRSKNSLFNSNYYQYENLKNSINSRQKYDYEINTSTTNTIMWGLNGLQSLIILMSLINVVLIYTGKRNYQLLYCKNRPSYKSAVHPASQESIFYMALYFIVNFFSKDDEEADDGDEHFHNGTEDIAEGESWQLRVWEPSKFSLYLYIALNPINNYIIHYFTSEISSLNILILITLVTTLNYKLIEGFLNLIQDKKILFQETFSEFNNKVVKPKTNILKKDAAIDAAMGPLYSSVLVNDKPYTFTKSKVFTTHDNKGKPTTEYIDSTIMENPEEDEVENLYFPKSQQPSRISSRMPSRAPSRAGSIHEYLPTNRQFPQSTNYHNEFNNSYYSSTPYQNQNPIGRMQSPASSRFTRTPTYSNNISYNRSPSPTHRSNINSRLSPQRLSPNKPNLDYPRNDVINSSHHSPITRTPQLYRSPSPQRTPIFYRSPSPRRESDSNRPRPGWK
ncbi:NUR1 [Candida pseudojiufengensis]|uniref:NUR1 n=1 Tax=Candida pseudojiufengensis TaxID=497109 RepID=UPI002224386B|nr:NUR1 [Candida pseudojiufengensis]KAI5965596.1 NUR1 [Candida pseudojiufengensis]